MANKQFRCGLYALSGDPVHNGHLDVITRASADCDELVVLVAVNAAKKHLFTLEERVAMVRRAVASLDVDNVRVISDPGLAVDVYLREDCDILIRGVRNADDIRYEVQLAKVNGLLLPGVGVHMIHAEDDLLQVVSSSMIKEIAMHHGPLELLAPMFVKQALEERMLGQRLVAVTGQIATGKTWVAKMLAERAKARGFEATYVNVDELLRQLYEEQTAGAQRVRERLAAAFGDQVLTADRRGVNRPKLAEALFSLPPSGSSLAPMALVRENTRIAGDITQDHVRRLLRTVLREAKGIVVLEWAQLAEMDMGRWMNNNAVVVWSPQREHFLAERKIPADRLSVMNHLQWTHDRKMHVLEGQALADDNGTALLHENVIDLAAVEAAKNGGNKAPSATSLAAIDWLLDQVIDKMFITAPTSSGGLR